MTYSRTSFGLEAEYVVALYLKSMGWTDVRLSRGSRGPADIVASHGDSLWLIQVKASTSAARLKGHEVRRLVELAESRDALAVAAIFQPSETGSFRTGNYAVTFFRLDSWKILDPTEALGKAKTVFSKSRARSL